MIEFLETRLGVGCWDPETTRGDDAVPTALPAVPAASADKCLRRLLQPGERGEIG